MWKLLRKYNKFFALFFGLIFFAELSVASVGFMSFHDPKEPNMGGFVPIEQSEMVNMFTGDFSYNIPLFEIGGYPINLSYSSTSVSNETEPSWVGLGWNLNPGILKRDMRGIPDDFSGDATSPDKIIQTDRMKPNERFSLGFAASATEAAGLAKSFGLALNARIDYFYSTYGGFGFNLGAGLSAVGGQPISVFAAKIFPTAALSFNLGTESGISVSPSLGLMTEFGENEANGKESNNRISSSVGLTFNSRTSRIDKNFNVNSSRNFIVNNLGALSSIAPSNLLTYGSSSISANRTFIPTGFLPIRNQASSLRFSLGPELFPVNFGFALDGSHSRQELANANDNNVLTRNLKPYGYLYYDQNKHYNKGGNAVYDFNRENEFELSEKSPAINLAFATYDYFTVQAQGLQGSYRFKSNGIDIVSDGNYSLFGEQDRNVESKNFGADAGLGATGKFGVNIGSVVAEGYQSGWDKFNLPFFGAMSSDSDKVDSKYQRKAIYQIGSTYKINTNQFDNLLGEEAFQFDLSESRGSMNSLNDLKSFYKLSPSLKGAGKSVALRPNYFNETRIEQSQPFTYLRADEILAHNGYYRKYIFDNSITMDGKTSIAPHIKPHHIAGAHVTRNDGMQFNFDLAAYNKKYKEVSFNISQLNNNHNVADANVAKYNTGGDLLPTGRGTTEFLSSKSIDPYAYAYHLTSIISPDYFDLRGDGPSKDDIGNYVKFDYELWNKAYKWKTPHGRGIVQSPLANLNENLYSDYNDDVGSYVYGEKEVFYVKSIESKDQVALFYVNNNTSLESISGEHGDYGTGDFLGRLDSIQIYTLQEFESEKEIKVPEQSIHFVYNYELCKIAGDGTGKLTLKKVFSTYRFQEVSAINSYIFNYGNNPDYGSNNSDRWGNYQLRGYTYPGIPDYDTPDFTASIEDRPISNTEFPFTSQVKEVADANASAWLLSNISLPSGGSIAVDYEADTYSFVQDKRAAKVFSIAGFGQTNSSFDINNNTSNLYSRDNDNFNNHNYMFVNLGAAQNANLDEDWHLATEGLNKVPIRCLVDITGEGDYEFVKLYADVDGVGTSTIRDTLYGYIKITEKRIKNNRKNGPDRLNQIAKHAIQTAYNKFSRKINGGGDLNPADENGFKSILNGLKGFKKDAENLFKGAVNAGLDRNYGRAVKVDKSFCVLYCPDGIKYGGGARVKQITMSDNWDEASSQDNLSRRQKEVSSIWQYDYTKTESIRKSAGGAFVSREISSGVAEWEPDNGSIENMCLDPLNIESADFFEPSGTFFQLKPYGTSIFPSPNVGYSSVKVTKSGLDGQSPAPYISKEEHQFYTAREFPVKSEQSNLKFLKAPKTPRKTFSFLSTRDSHVASASQGFSIVLNDMHGKALKSTYFKGAAEAPYKEVSYKYKTDGNALAPELSNTKDFISPNGEVISNMVNVDMDITIDSKEYYHKSIDTKYTANADFLLIAFFGAILPTLFKPTKIQSTFARSLSTTKVVSKYAILDEVTTREDGATLVEKDLVYDANSGQPVLSQIQNDFGDNIYSLNIPAYWVYPNFGPRFSRDKMQLTGIQDINSATVVEPGDVLLDVGKKKKIHVFSNESGLNFLDNGSLATNSEIEQPLLNPFQNTSEPLLLLSRGSQNRLTLSAARYTLLDNPINDNNRLNLASSLRALNAEFSVFKQYPVPKDCRALVTESLKPEQLAVIGHRRWFEQGTAKPLGVRKYTIDDNTQNPTYLASENYDLRKDGALTVLPRFFVLSAGRWRKVGSFSLDGWIGNEIGTYNLYAKPLNVADATGIQSTYAWTFNQNLAKYKVYSTQGNSTNNNTELNRGVDKSTLILDFELYPDLNSEDNLQELGLQNQPVRNEHHTGVSALKVGPLSREKLTISIKE